MTVNELQELYTLAIEQIEDVHIQLGNYQQNVVINKRAKTRWGACKPIVEKQLIGQKISYQIEIAQLLVENGTKRDVLNTLIHELLHTCKGCQNHGEKWKKYAEIMNRTYGYSIQRVTAQKENVQVENRKNLAKYKVECVKCGAAFYRMKRSKVIQKPAQYRCAKCGGKFKVYELIS